MARFCDLGVNADVVVGKGIEIEELFNRRVLIEKTIISPTKYPGKNTSGLRMQMQVVLAAFRDTPNENGDYFVKGSDGLAAGERRSCFTGSDILISAIQKAEALMSERSKAEGHFISIYPMDTTIVKIGKCFQFT